MTFTGKALIVDDEPHVRKYISLILRSLGASAIVEAANGAEGFAMYQQERPDLVLLDVNMPVQDGLETIKQIRAFDPEAVVIMLTSLATRQTIEQAADSGALHYLRKDTPRDELIALLKDLLTEEAEDETA
ncbi:response regulator transcription factor [Rariglobus hedericola]|uniref:Response regulator n=1 Tax=Rariglobus hedericola TaxID=2597822 RepID=A0A556QNX8_9BACT|nr:response regulator transcription factor [Rariglobus hedericola]TSJ78358.1 response regulator [Rariglobus hedericola]